MFDNKTPKSGYLFLAVVIALTITLHYFSHYIDRKKTEKVPISKLFQEIDSKDVTSITIADTLISWETKNQDQFISVDDRLHTDKLVATIGGYNKSNPPITLEIKNESHFPWVDILLVALMALIVLPSLNRHLMPFHAKKTNGKTETTFNDVAGIEEAVEEVSGIVDFLKDPDKYIQMGAKMPKGVLLFGPPGSGKTLLARAIAGEAGVAFFYLSGSDFVEIYVGVGAKRIRDLFAEAKAAGRAIVFVDEIDAVGARRGLATHSGNSETDQTLNALLSEMDGFGENTGVIFIGATNRPDVLDPALLRPGRFDRRVMVSLPDNIGRFEILRLHAKAIPMGPDISLQNLASTTVGMSGAELTNILNEAAIMAVENSRGFVTNQDLELARDKQIMGKQQKSRLISLADRKIAAIHESGHAVAQIVLAGNDPVHKISIIPQGHALGVTMFMPERDVSLYTRTMLQNQMTTILAGRAAEECFCDDITTGAENDLKRATEIARSMIERFGMNSSIGLIDCTATDDYGVSLISDVTAKSVDDQIKLTLDDAYSTARKLLKSNEELVRTLADRLVEIEVLNAEQIYAIVYSVGIKPFAS